MNPDAPLLARDTFLQAVQPGLMRAPAAVASVLAKLDVQTDNAKLDVDELVNALDAEFPWRNQLVSSWRPLKPEELEDWVHAIRWLMQSVLVVDMSADGSARRFQVLLTALGVLDVRCEGLSVVSDRFVGSQVTAGIISILQMFIPESEGLDTRSKEWLRKLPVAVKAGNFLMLREAKAVLPPLPFRADIWTSVFLLWRLEPVELARLVNSRDSILFDLLVCRALNADAPLFALQVESVTFKFFSVPWLGQMKCIYPEIDTLGVLEKLLLQVAKTPHWKGWLQANYEYPTAGSKRSIAMAKALAQLAEPQWKDFIFALALSKSRDSAEAVADILTQVLHNIGSAKAQPIWSMAFERWNAWDYGRHEEHFSLSSTQVCAFDFPVAMYYSHMLPAERGALELELQDAIFHIEQRWFSNELELCTERNLLASRLRLVRHGSALAAGDADVLPAPVQPDSEYAEVRYLYLDINAAHARTQHLA